jgi:transcriptional regulator with GAF, ATPase, and Fis domain
VSELQQRLSDAEHRLHHTERERDEARRSSAETAERSHAAAVEEARRQGGHDHAHRLVHAVRLLDEARSLGEVLDVLGQGAAGDSTRVAVLVAKGNQLVGWTLLGFGEAAPHARDVTVELGGSGLLQSVAASGSAEPRSAADTSEGVGLPAFATEAGDTARSAVALPLVVGGAVVAVLYADHPAAARDIRRLSATLDVLARHASKVLEGLTVHQAVGLSLPARVARASHDAVAGLSHDRSVP